MSEGAGARFKVRSPQDFYGGLVLIGLAVIALVATRELPGMHGFAFGPGTAPRMFAVLLILMGAVVSFIGLVTDGPPLDKYDIRSPVLILIAYFLFRYTAQPVWTWVSIGIAAVAAVFAFIGLRGPRNAMVRGPLLITIALLVFAETVRPLGLVLSTFITIMISAYGTTEFRWLESLIWAAVLTLFCSLLFPYALGLPLYLWPRF